MTIVFIVDCFPTLSETFILNQITGLIDLGHEVLIFSNSRSDEPRYHDDIHKYDLLKKTYYLNDRPNSKLMRIMWAGFLILAFMARNPKAVFNSLNVFKYGKEAASLNYLFKMMLFLGIGRIDAVICHYGPNGNFAVLMKEMGLRFKVLTMFHGYDIRRGIAQGGAIYAQLFKKGDVFLSISDYNTRHLRDFGAPVEKIHNHPVGIDLQRYNFKERAVGSGPIKIISVGRLVSEKGIEYGIRAFRKLLDRLPGVDIEYGIVGDGPLRESLEGLVKSLGIGSKVHFYGYQIQLGVIDLLNQSHLFFLPSVEEALPIVLMEAQACGLPCVATDVGSISQEVVDGQSGFLVASQDEDAMAGRLEELIKHPDQWAEMGRVGRKHIEEHYDILRLNRRLEKFCRESLG